MTKHLLTHFRNNVIGYLALFVALGGTSYASVAVPQASRVIYGHASAQTSKTAKGTGTCYGKCPATTVLWGYFGLNVAGTAWIPLQTPIGGYNAVLTHAGVGDFIVHYEGLSNFTNCVKFANLTQIRGSATPVMYSSVAPDAAGITVLTTDQYGNPVDADFDLMIVCGGGQGPSLTSSAAALSAPSTGVGG